MKSVKWGVASIWIMFAGVCAAADLPPIVAKYEELALKQSPSGAAVGTLMDYAMDADAGDAILERWESRAKAGAETYRIWEGRLLSVLQRTEEARVVFRQAAERLPKEETVWLAWGKLEAASNSSEARPLLEKAVEQSRGGASFDEAVEQLAADHIAHERWPEAWTLLQKSWSRALPASRKKMLEKWVVVADQQGRLAELVKELEQAWKDGSDRGIGLAQFYLTIGDDTLAWAIIMEARRQYPDDADVRAQAIAMARKMSDLSELARLWRELAAATPSAENRRELFRALVGLGARLEALKLCEENVADFVETPGEWHYQIHWLTRLGMAPQLAEILKAGTSWEAAFVQAELQLAAGEREKTEPLLWSLLDPKWDENPLSSLTLKSDIRVTGLKASLPGSGLSNRTYQIPDSLPAAPMPRTGSASIKPTMALQTVQDARLMAIQYLAILASERGTENRYLDRLDQAIASWPIEERLLVWANIQNSERTLREIEAIAARPQRNAEADRFCVFCLSNLLGSNSEASPRAKELRAKFAELRQQMAVSQPNQRESLFRPISQMSTSFRQGDFEGVRKQRAEFYDQWLASQVRLSMPRPGDLIWNIIPSLPGFKKDPEKNAEASLTLLQFLIGMQKGRRTVRPYCQPEVASPPALRQSSSLVDGIARSLSEEELRRFVYPHASFLDSSSANCLWAIFLAGKDPQMWPRLKVRLDASLAGADSDWLELAPVVTAYFAWWYGDLEDAVARMKKILDRNDSVGGRRALASMLQKQLEWKEADELLAGISLPYPAFSHVIDEWRGDGALAARDTALLGQLFDRRHLSLAGEWKTYPWLTGLEELKSEKEANVLRERLAERALVEEVRRSFPTALNDLERDGKRWDVQRAALANKMLDEADDAANAGNEPVAGMRRAALRCLKDMDALNDYVARLEREKVLGGDVEILDARISDAQKETNELKKLWDRRLVRQDTEREELRKRLTASTEAQGWVETFATLFLLEPEETLARIHTLTTRESSDVRSNFRPLLPGAVQGRILPIADFDQAGRLNRLVEIVEQAPLARRSREGEKSLDETLARLAERCVARGSTELAVRVLKRASEILVPQSPAIQRQLFTQLLVAGKKEEAGKALLDYLALQPTAAPVLFAWGQERVINAYVGKTTPQYTVMEPGRDDPVNYKLAHTLGVLAELKLRISKEVAGGRMPSNRLLLIGVVERDESVLPTLKEMVSSWKQAPRSSWARPLTFELAEWPAAREVCLLAIDRQISNPEPDSTFAAQRNIELAQAAIRIGETGPSKKALRQLLTVIYRDLLQNSNESPLRLGAITAAQVNDGALLSEICEMAAQIVDQRGDNWPVHYSACLEIAGIALQREQVNDMERLFKALKRRPQAQRDASIANAMAAFQFDLDIRQGDWSRAEPVVWLAPAESTAKNATIYWDAGIFPRGLQRSAYPIVVDSRHTQGFPKYTLELLQEEEGNSYKVLATIPECTPQGVWRGVLPLAAGKVRAIFHGDERSVFGQTIPMAFGRPIWSLGQNEDDALLLTSRASALNAGGPVKGGKYLSCFPSAQPEKLENKMVSLGRVKIEPGQSYVISGWSRSNASLDLKLRWRGLDQAGREVGQGFVTGGTPQAQLWNYFWQRLDVAIPQKRPGLLSDRIVEMELTAQDDGRGFDAAAWTVVQLPAEDNPQTNTVE